MSSGKKRASSSKSNYIVWFFVKFPWYIFTLFIVNIGYFPIKTLISSDFYKPQFLQKKLTGERDEVCNVNKTYKIVFLLANVFIWCADVKSNTYMDRGDCCKISNFCGETRWYFKTADSGRWRCEALHLNKLFIDKNVHLCSHNVHLWFFSVHLWSHPWVFSNQTLNLQPMVFIVLILSSTFLMSSFEPLYLF